MKRRRVILLFIDGLGIGSADREINPLANYPDLWPVQGSGSIRKDLLWTSLDACLGIEGLPQSATGQTALLTGLNAPVIMGKHMQGFPSKKLVEILKRESIFVQLTKQSYNTTFANAYRHPEDIAPTSRLSVTSHAFQACGKPFRSIHQIEGGEALYHDFTNEELRKNGYDVPLFTPEQAGDILVQLAMQYDFTLYEHFMTDVVAHRGNPEEIREQIAKLSDFVRTILDLVDPLSTTVIITSDHGNVEDISVKTHTRNPVPLIWNVSPSVPSGENLNGITEITPWIKRILKQNAIK